MVSEVGLVSSTSGVSNTSYVAAPAAAPIASAFTASLSSASVPSTPSALLHSPKVVQDPTAGFITEYLSANGSQIVSQTPSAITVAYLRVGLTADGLSKAQTEHPVATTA